MPHRTIQSKTNPNSGFALVIALSLMAFILLLLLSITTLTQVESKNAQTHLASLQAQQNAILGMQIALGDLQKFSGPDQRITASASIFDTDRDTDTIEGVSHPHWIGVWNSEPELAHLNDRLDTSNAYYDYEARRDGSDNRFLGWLVSGNQDAIVNRDANIAPSDELLIYGAEFDPSDTLQLANQVRVEKVSVNGGTANTGSYAFWVADENIKARIDAYQPKTSSVTDSDLARSRFMVNQRSAIEKVNSQGDIFATITGDSDTDVINAFFSPEDLSFITNNTADLAISLKRNSHALTTSSYSLLTDTYASGLRIDLSTLLRQSSFNAALDTGVPAYANSDGSHAIAQYLASAGSYLVPPSATWEQLQSYATTTASSSSGIITARKHSSSEQGYYPVVTRYRLNIVPVLEHDSSNGDPLNYYIEPVVVLANPYNASMRLGSAMYVVLYFEKRDLNNYRGIRIGNVFIKWPPPTSGSGGIAQSIGDGFSGADLFENADLAKYTDSNGIEYAGFTFKLPDAMLAPGEVTSFGVASDGASYSGNNLLKQGAFNTGTSYVVLPHKDAAGNILRADPNWSALDENASPSQPPQAALQINIDTGAIQQGFIETTNPKTGNPIHVKLLPYKMAVGLSDQNEPTDVGDFYCLAQGFEGSNPNAQMRISEGQDQKYDRNRNAKVGSLYDYTSMLIRAVNFDIVMAGGFEYADNNILGGTESCATGFRINNRWLIGHNFRASHHAPIASDHPDKATNTLYGAIGGYAPSTELGDFFHHNPTVEIDDAGRAYWGTGIDETTGLKTNIFFDLPSPSVGILSLAQLQHMQISTISSSDLYGIGNGVANLKIGDTGLLFKESGFEASVANAYLPIDQSYLLNNALWDSFFFSGLSTDIDASQLTAWYSTPLNNRYIFSASATSAQVNDASTTAATLYVRGGFNINSTDKEAWKAIIAGANTLNIDPSDNGNPRSLQSPVSRSSFPQEDSGDSYKERINGFRELRDIDVELDNLAEQIVATIKARGPFLSLADFVNRRIEAGNTPTGLYGTLEAALQASRINDTKITKTTGPLNEYSDTDLPKWVTKPVDYISELFFGPRGEGISQWITQGDLLQRIAPFISARSDTFTIRGYGEAIDPINGEAVAKATCEAIVQRVYEYIDATGNQPNQSATVFNNATENFEQGSLTAINQQFGRKYKIISFKWL